MEIFAGSKSLKKAQKMILKGKNSEAKEMIEELIKAKPSDQDLLLWLAIAKSNLKDYTGGLAAIEEAIKLGSKDSVCNMIKGEILLSLDKYKDALEALTIAIDSNPDNTRISYFIGLTHLKMGDIDLASNFFEVAIKYDRELVDSRLLAMAELYLHKNR